MAGLHFVSEKNKGKILKRATTNATNWIKRKSLFTFVDVAQVINTNLNTYTQSEFLERWFKS